MGNHRIFQYQFQKTTLLIALCLGCIGGVFSSIVLQSSWELVIFAFLAIATIPSRKIISVIACVYIGIVFGLSRASYVGSERESLTKYIGQKVQLIVTAYSEGAYDSRKRISFDARANELLVPAKSVVSAPVRVNTYISTGVFPGDIIRVSGKLSPGYGNNSATIGYAEIEVIGQSKTLPIRLRTNFITTIRNYLPEPVASFSIGLLIGQKTGLSADLQDTLRMAGLTHIIAVSGYNLTIIIRVVKRLLKRLSRFKVLAISFSLVLLFIGVTGMSPSILRAFIVTTLMLLSWYVGRKPRPVVLLLLAAAVSSLIEPNQLLSSVGWYLSFGAFTGVIIIAPLIIEKIKRKTLLKSIFIESFAASIMTLPIIALVFGQVSFTGILANSVVVPLVPLAMVCSIITYLGALIHPTIGFLAAYPTKYLLKFILDFAKEVSLLPGTNIKIQLHGVIAGIFYGLILMAVFALYSKKPVIDVLQ